MKDGQEENAHIIQLLFERYRRAAYQVGGSESKSNYERLSQVIGDLPISDLGFTNSNGNRSRKINSFTHRQDENGTSTIFHLGRLNGKVWDLVVVDDINSPNKKPKADSELVFFDGAGFVYLNQIWVKYRSPQDLKISAGTSYGFVTDPALGATVFLFTQPVEAYEAPTCAEDLIPLVDEFPIPAHYLEWRRNQLAQLAA
jgi:hypothetical protein